MLFTRAIIIILRARNNSKWEIELESIINCINKWTKERTERVKYN